VKTPLYIQKIFLIILMIFLIGCASTNQNDSLIGKWKLVSVSEDEQKIGSAPDNEERILEFFLDGTVTIDFSESSESEMTRSTYKLVGNQLTFDGMIGVLLGTEHIFALDGNKLSLKGNSITLDFIRLR
jgi:hypothetical protein